MIILKLESENAQRAKNEILKQINDRNYETRMIKIVQEQIYIDGKEIVLR